MKLKIKNINNVLFNKNIYLLLFIFFFIFLFNNSHFAMAAECKGPADVVLVIDKSANMFGGTKFETVKSSSIDFINSLFSIPPYGYPFYYHQIGLVVFNNNINSNSLTTEYTSIQDIISGLDAPDSSCRAGEAVQKAQYELNANGNSESTKTIIILIAGPPDDLSLAIDRVRIATESGTRIISVGINLNELTGQQKEDAESFISNMYIPSYDCYYASSDVNSVLDGCTTILDSDLNNVLNIVYNNITESVCDEFAPELEIYRIPSGTLYDIDKLIITSNATDDIGFKSHSIVWSDNWPNDQKEITDCSLVGKVISCNTGGLGPFDAGKIINFGSSATDANDNVVTIDPVDNSVTVATVSLNVPTLFRNKDNDINVQISDYSGADEFYIRVDNGELTRVVNEEDISSKITCSGIEPTRNCVYSFNPGCASEGIYTDPDNAVDVYIYAKSSGITRTSYIASEFNNILALPNVGVSFDNCTNQDTNCNGIIDSEEISCDSEPPIITITRTNPIEANNVYDDDESITLKSEASDSNSTIKRNTIYYRIAGSSEWETAFNCNDIAVIDGKCDEDTSKSIASYSVVINSIFPVSAGTEIEYYSEAVDSSGNNNTSSTSIKSFVVRSRECYGVNDLGSCNITTEGKCCGEVCNTAISNPNLYNIDFCAEETCNGTSLEWKIANNNADCRDGENSDGCYHYGSFFDGGCEERDYSCLNGYCVSTISNRNDDYCMGGGSLILNDYECVSGYCELDPSTAIENDICDLELDSLSVNAYNSNDVLISGSDGIIEGDVLDNLTNKVSIQSVTSDLNGISEQKIYWKKASESNFNVKNCNVNSCGDSSNPCSCTKDIGPFSIGEMVSFYSSSKDNSPNQTESIAGTNGLRYYYYDGTNFNTFQGSGVDTDVNHQWQSNTVSINGHIWENQSDYVSIIWEGFIIPKALGEHTFYVSADDGIKLYLDNNLVIDKWFDQGTTEYSAIYNFTSLEPVSIRIEWYESGGYATMQLGWAPPNELKTYPIPASNLIAPYLFTVRDNKCYEVPEGAKTNLTLCDSGNGRCCGGICDSSRTESSIYDDECTVDACSGESWIEDKIDEFGFNKDTNPCGSNDSCFDYYSPNNNFYSGCITGGNKCSSGYCTTSSTLTSTPICNGNLLSNYSCNPDNATGICQLKDSNIDCSSVGDYDSDNIACNCDCNGYDKEEKVYSSLSFDGVDDYVKVEHDNSINPTSAITIEMWAKSNTSLWNNYGFMVSKRNAYIMHPRLNTKTMNFYVYLPGAGGWKEATTNIDDITIWNHYVGTYDSSTGKLKLYVNGDLKKEETYSGTINADTGPMFIGKDDGFERYFNGSIDEVRIYNRALYPEEVIDHYNGIFADNTGLVGHWNFDEGTGEIVNDGSGNGNDGFLSNVDGKLYNMNNNDWVDGKYGSGLDFDGNNDYVNISGDLGNPNEMSLEFWFYVSESDKNRTQFFMDGRNGGNWWFLQSYNPNGSGNINFNDNVKVDSSKWNAGQWNHIILTTNSSNSKIYINGELKATGSAFNPDIGENMRIGTRYMNSNYFKGKFDEVRVYNRALSDTEASNHYKGIFVNNSSLVGYWNFNEGTGTTAYDSSENGPQWMKYHHDSVDGTGGNVPVSWQVCTDGKDNNCDNVADEYESNNSLCDGKVDGITINANSKRIGVGGATAIATINEGVVESITVINGGSGYTSSPVISITGGGGSGATATAVLVGGVITSFDITNGGSGYTSPPTVSITGGNLLNFSTPVDYDVYDIDVSQPDNDFTLSVVASDDFGIYQTLIEWTTDNWGTINNVICDSTGICDVCVVGGSCDNDKINTSSLLADNVFTYRACSWDNNNNKICSDDYSFIVLNSNSTPWLTDLEVISPDFCEDGLKYILSWKFNDNDILDKQSYYEVQVKEGNNDWTIGPFVVNLLKYITADNASFSYHPIINGENKEIGTAESSTLNTITDDNALWIVDEWKGGEIRIISGAGAGQTRKINSNTTTTIIVDTDWDSDNVPDNTSEFEVISSNLEYGEKEYYWRVRAADNKTGGYAKTSEWVEGSGPFITPNYKFPQVEFSANLESDYNKDCLLESCNFGEDIVFHDDTSFFVNCNSSNNKQCLSTDAARCDVSEGQCVSCSDNSECSKFNSLPNISYSCISGICKSSGSCASDDDCKSVDNAKCDIDNSKCTICDDDSQCSNEKFDTTDINYFCNNEGKCENKEHRKWWFYGDDSLDPDSENPNPINNYVESIYNSYNVILKITDITGKQCSKSKNIILGGELYPKWNEISPSN